MFEPLRIKHQAYLRLLQDSEGRLHPDALIVLADLKKFCYVDRSTLKISPVTRTVDTHATMLAEGRREVWNRIQAFLKISDQQLRQLNEDEP